MVEGSNPPWRTTAIFARASPRCSGTCYHTLDSEFLDMDIATRPATISIVVPCFNERESLPIFLTELSRVSSLFKDSTPPRLNLR